MIDWRIRDKVLAAVLRECTFNEVLTALKEEFSTVEQQDLARGLNKDVGAYYEGDAPDETPYREIVKGFVIIRYDP